MWELVLVMSVYSTTCSVCVCELPTVYVSLWSPVQMKLINRKLSVGAEDRRGVEGGKGEEERSNR